MCIRIIMGLIGLGLYESVDVANGLYFFMKFGNSLNFSGDDGMSKEPQSGVLVKESESVYTLWCTGRQYCEGMLVELKVRRLVFFS